MESLPNEIQLLIFRYLHKFDILYAFYNLNQRYQRIIQPYLHEIDLTQTNITYKQCLLFLERIVFVQGKLVRFLKFNVEHHLLLIPRIRLLNGLQSLTIVGCLPFDKKQAFLAEGLSLSTLSEISLDIESELELQIIAASASSNLTTLILRNQYGVSHYYLSDVSQMLYVKCISMMIDSFEALVKIFETIPNIVELNLLIPRTFDIRDTTLKKIPAKLRKLQIEIEHDKWRRGSFALISNFLNLFKDQIYELILIIREAPEEFSSFEKFQSLTSNFTRLQIFNYNILTNYQPDSRFSNIEQLPYSNYYLIFTLPKSKPVFIDFKQCNPLLTVTSYSTLEELCNCNSILISTHKLSERFPIEFESIPDDCSFNNLKQLELDCMVKGVEKTHQYVILSSIVARSPNLDTILIRSHDTKTIIVYLKELVSEKHSKNIIHLVVRECTSNGGCDSSSSSSDYDYRTSRLYPPTFHSSFFYELSQILPNLQTLAFPCGKAFLDKYSTKNSSYIGDLRQNCPKLTHLKLKMDFLGKKVDFTPKWNNDCICLEIWLDFADF